MANNNKSSLTASRTIPMVLQYLKENGFEEAFAALQIESSMEYEKCAPHKPAQLLEALTVWDDVRSKGDTKSQEVSPQQRLDDALLVSRVVRDPQPLPPVAELATSLDGVHKMNVIACRFHPDPSKPLLASGGADKLIKITDWKTAKVEASVDCKGPVLSVDFHPIHHNLVLVGCMNNSARVVDWTTGATLQEFKEHQKYVPTVRWSPDGAYFITASHDKTVNLYAPTTAASSSDAKSAAPTAWTLKHTFPFLGAVECAVWLPNGFALSANDSAATATAATGTTAAAGSSTASSAAAAGPTFVVGVRNDPYLHALSASGVCEVAKYNTNARGDEHVSFTPLDLVLSPGDAQFLAVPTDGHRVIVFRTGTTRQVRNLYGFTADGFSNPRVTWAADGAFLYATSQDMTVVCWDVATGKVVGRLKGHANTIRDIAHHPNSEVLATVAFDKTIKLWKQTGANVGAAPIKPTTAAAAKV